jgi:transcriptional regulator of NAD metabolism
MRSNTINAVISQHVGTERDYASCLNAMHEAEKVLTPEQQQTYVDHLADVCEVYIDHDVGGWGDFCAFAVFHATAAQRAEAFLRTIGKWKDSK